MYYTSQCASAVSNSIGVLHSLNRCTHHWGALACSYARSCIRTTCDASPHSAAASPLCLTCAQFWLVSAEFFSSLSLVNSQRTCTCICSPPVQTWYDSKHSILGNEILSGAPLLTLRLSLPFTNCLHAHLTAIARTLWFISSFIYS